MPYDPSNANLNFPALQTTPLRGIPVAAQTPITDAYNIWLARKARQEQRAKDQRTEIREDRRVGAVEEQARAQTAQVKVQQDKAERERMTDEENKKASAWVQQQYMTQSAGMDPRGQLDLFVRLGYEAQSMFPGSNVADEAQKLAGKRMEMMKSMAPRPGESTVSGGTQTWTDDPVTGRRSYGTWAPGARRAPIVGDGVILEPPPDVNPGLGQIPALAPTAMNPAQIPPGVSVSPALMNDPNVMAMINDPAALAQIAQGAGGPGGQSAPPPSSPLWADRPAVQNPAVMPQQQQGWSMRQNPYARQSGSGTDLDARYKLEMDKADRKEQQQTRMVVRSGYVDQINKITSAQNKLLEEMRKPAPGKGTQLPKQAEAERKEREKAITAAQTLYEQLEIQKNAEIEGRKALDRMTGMPIAEAMQAAEDAKAAYLESVRRSQEEGYYRSLNPGEGPMQGPPSPRNPALGGGTTEEVLRRNAAAPAISGSLSTADAPGATNVATARWPQSSQIDWKKRRGLEARR